MNQKEKIISILKENNIDFEIIKRNPENAFKNEKEENDFWDQAVKTLICYDKKKNIHIFMIPVSATLNQVAARKIIHSNKMRFVSREILMEEFQLIIGAISPLQMLGKGNMILDEKLNKFDQVTISSGELGSGIQIKKSDLILLVKPTISNIT